MSRPTICDGCKKPVFDKGANQTVIRHTRPATSGGKPAGTFVRHDEIDVHTLACLRLWLDAIEVGTAAVGGGDAG